MDARRLDLGMVSPLDLHGACQGVAEAQGTDGRPVLLWGRAAAHVSVGASQAPAAELDVETCRRLGVEVVRRPIGGGTVLVDPAQLCFFLIIPRRHAPQRRRELFASYLRPVAATFADCGLPVEQHGSDLWLGGRKILGSGAATIGRADVLAASFLLGFSARLFARLIRSPSEGFRDWLHAALARGMTCWAEHAPLPHPGELEGRLERNLLYSHEWRLRPDRLSCTERAAMAVARAELEADRDLDAPRRVPSGLKINHVTYLVERREGDAWVRLLLERGRLARAAASDARVEQVLADSSGEAPDSGRVQRQVARALGGGPADVWTRLLGEAVRGIDYG